MKKMQAESFSGVSKNRERKESSSEYRKERERRHQEILKNTEDWEEIFETFKQIPDNDPKMKYNLAIAKGKFNLPVDPDVYPRDFQIGESYLQQYEGQEDYKVLRQVVYSYDSRRFGVIDSVVVKKNTAGGVEKVEAIGFVDPVVGEHFYNHLEGKSFSPEKKEKISNINVEVFKLLKEIPKSKEELKKFAKKREWDFLEDINIDNLKSFLEKAVTGGSLSEKEQKEIVDFCKKDSPYFNELVEKFPHLETLENFEESVKEKSKNRDSQHQKKLQELHKNYYGNASIEESLDLAFFKDKLVCKHLKSQGVEIPQESKAKGCLLYWGTEIMGYSKQDMVDAGWAKFDVKASGEADYAIKKENEHGIIFIPFKDKEGTILFRRIRTLDPKASAKYLSSTLQRELNKDSQAQEGLYNRHFLEKKNGKDAEVKGKTVVITEGEFKAAIMSMMYPTVSIPGITMVTPALIDSLVEAEPAKIIVCLDRDERGKAVLRPNFVTDSESAAYSIAKDLEAAIAKTNRNIKVEVATLPNAFDNKKVGGDDLILEHKNGIELFEIMIDREKFAKKLESLKTDEDEFALFCKRNGIKNRKQFKLQLNKTEHPDGLVKVFCRHIKVKYENLEKTVSSEKFAEKIGLDSVLIELKQRRYNIKKSLEIYRNAKKRGFPKQKPGMFAICEKEEERALEVFDALDKTLSERLSQDYYGARSFNTPRLNEFSFPPQQIVNPERKKLFVNGKETDLSRLESSILVFNFWTSQKTFERALAKNRPFLMQSQYALSEPTEDIKILIGESEKKLPEEKEAKHKNKILKGLELLGTDFEKECVEFINEEPELELIGYRNKIAELLKEEGLQIPVDDFSNISDSTKDKILSLFKRDIFFKGGEVSLFKVRKALIVAEMAEVFTEDEYKFGEAEFHEEKNGIVSSYSSLLVMKKKNDLVIGEINVNTDDAYARREILQSQSSSFLRESYSSRKRHHKIMEPVFSGENSFFEKNKEEAVTLLTEMGFSKADVLKNKLTLVYPENLEKFPKRNHQMIYSGLFEFIKGRNRRGAPGILPRFYGPVVLAPSFGGKKGQQITDCWMMPLSLVDLKNKDGELGFSRLEPFKRRIPLDFFKAAKTNKKTNQKKQFEEMELSIEKKKRYLGNLDLELEALSQQRLRWEIELHMRKEQEDLERYSAQILGRDYDQGGDIDDYYEQEKRLGEADEKIALYQKETRKILPKSQQKLMNMPKNIEDVRMKMREVESLEYEKEREILRTTEAVKKLEEEKLAIEKKMEKGGKIIHITNSPDAAMKLSTQHKGEEFWATNKFWDFSEQMIQGLEGCKQVIFTVSKKDRDADFEGKVQRFRKLLFSKIKGEKPLLRIEEVNEETNKLVPEDVSKWKGDRFEKWEKEYWERMNANKKPLSVFGDRRFYEKNQMTPLSKKWEYQWFMDFDDDEKRLEILRKMMELKKELQENGEIKKSIEDEIVSPVNRLDYFFKPEGLDVEMTLDMPMEEGESFRPYGEALQQNFELVVKDLNYYPLVAGLKVAANIKVFNDKGELLIETKDHRNLFAKER